MYTCAMCNGKYCDIGELDKIPKNCPCHELNEIKEILKLYENDEEYKLAYYSALVEAEGYCQKTRLEETIDFLKKCGYRKLGIAFCVGLSKEAKSLNTILRYHGFEVYSVVCKNCSIEKEFLKIKDEEKVSPGFYEPMCNPIGQAYFLNKAETDFNIVLGLCIGHDSLFLRHSEAPVTVFAVKDRVLAHNPIAALYQEDSYYKDKIYNR